jgi:hypothetical protein
LGQTERAPGTPPTKWEVYEQILRVPYYILFDRYTNNLRAFQLVGGHYQPLDFTNQRIQIPEWTISLGVWQGSYEGIERLWLRWFDAEERLILSAEERAEQAEEQVNQAEERANRLAERLRELGIDPDEV